MEIPGTLDAWTLQAIQEIVATGVAENQDFEFKDAGVLRDNNGREQLSKAVCAFANARGGFIIIGVADKPRRIQGIEPDQDIAKHLNDRIKVYPMPAYPSPRTIQASGGRQLVVVHIPASRAGPHAVVIDGPPRFYQRTHSGSEAMQWINIRNAMLGADERRRNVDIILDDLAQFYMVGRSHKYATLDKEPWPNTSQFDLERFRMATTVLYGEINADRHLSDQLAQLFSRLNYLNGHIDAMTTAFAVRPQSLPDWRARMNVAVGGLPNQIAITDAYVRRVFGLPEPQGRRFPDY